MAKIQKIEDHARVVQNSNRNSYRMKDWQCLHCTTRFEVWYDDFKNLRAHMRRNHPMEYRPYTIDEEPEHDDRLSLLLA